MGKVWVLDGSVDTLWFVSCKFTIKTSQICRAKSACGSNRLDKVSLNQMTTRLHSTESLYSSLSKSELQHFSCTGLIRIRVFSHSTRRLSLSQGSGEFSRILLIGIDWFLCLTVIRQALLTFRVFRCDGYRWLTLSSFSPWVLPSYRPSQPNDSRTNLVTRECLS